MDNGPQTAQEHIDEAALIATAGRDPEAFAVLYRRYVAPLYRYFYYRLSSGRDAEDLTTQVFIDVLEGLARRQYREDGCFIAWLFTIARRRLADFYRQRPTARLDDSPAPDAGLLAAIEKGEDLRRLGQLLARLDEERQELLRMRFSVGLSFGEIGQIEGRSEAAVKMAVYRALEFLRDHWEVENE